MKIKIKLTPFGHLGIFPEQKSNWDLIRSLGSGYSQEEVLNLFAYSGLSTIACLLAEMPVCHVDSSKGMVDWARENAMINNLENKKVRWIIEDVLKFVKREVKRKKIYNIIILTKKRPCFLFKKNPKKNFVNKSSKIMYLSLLLSYLFCQLTTNSSQK